MKKEYISPDMELVLFESTKAMLDEGVEHSDPEPDWGAAGISFDDLPNSYVIDDNDFVNFKQ